PSFTVGHRSTPRSNGSLNKFGRNERLLVGSWLTVVENSSLPVQLEDEGVLPSQQVKRRVLRVLMDYLGIKSGRDRATRVEYLVEPIDKGEIRFLAAWVATFYRL